jgi:superfamily II DNA or RNA helicase
MNSREIRPSEYQLVALTKLLLNGLDAVLICDGVGVGKTISAGFCLTYLCARNEQSAWVVCPPMLQDKWSGELRHKFGFSVVPVRSREELDYAVETAPLLTDRPRVFILSSSLLPDAQAIAPTGPVVIDEIHNFRNPETRGWSALSAFLRQSSFRVGLSATPINNVVQDLAAAMALLLRVDFIVANAILDDVWRPQRRHLLASLLTRFSKEKLGVHFTRRLVHDIPIVFPTEYMNSVVTAVKGRTDRPANDTIYLDEITLYRLAASSPRAFTERFSLTAQPPVQKQIALNNILARHANEPVIVCCVFEESVRDVAEWTSNRVTFTITGTVPQFERENRLRAFEASHDGVLIMTAVGTEGLDLQFCAALVNYDLVWNPMVLEQRAGRVDRIGQTKHDVNIYNMMVEGSIDERILRVLLRKLRLLNNSLLEPKTLLEERDSTPHMYDGRSLEKERDAGERLVRATELSSELSIDDDAVLSAIDSRFCDPLMLRRLTPEQTAPWLNETTQAALWTDTVREQGDALRTMCTELS